MFTEELYGVFRKCKGISTDTREDLNDTLFFAIKGENFDGNKFAETAIDKGASYAVVSETKFEDNENFIIVEDTIDTLQKLAAFHRKQLKIPVIAISGSNGKTTTKELISRVLSKKYKCFSTPGNLNNHIGLPVSLLKINDEHEIAVIEIGANHKGENKILTEICEPDYGITTNIGKDHLGEFGGMEGIVKAYKEFFDYFGKGKEYEFFLNYDDLNLRKLAQNINYISYGSSESDFNKNKTDYYGLAVPQSDPLQVLIRYKQGKRDIIELMISSKLFGSFNLSNILAAVCIGKHFNVMDEYIIPAIEEFNPENKRSQIIDWSTNKVYMDAYNANPTSMILALKDFAELNFEKKIVILGNMNELGEYSEDEHRKIVNKLPEFRFNKVILTGVEFKKLKDSIDCLYFENSGDINKWIEDNEFNHTAFLVKGSRGEQLERSFEGLI